MKQKCRIKSETENKHITLRFGNWASKVLSIPLGLTAHKVRRKGKDFYPSRRKYSDVGHLKDILVWEQETFMAEDALMKAEKAFAICQGSSKSKATLRLL